MGIFFNIIFYGYFVLAGYAGYIIWRDLKNQHTFIGRHKKISIIKLILIFIGLALAVDTHFIEPWTIKITKIKLPTTGINRNIKIAWITDLQIGNHKKSAWTEHIVEQVEQAQPDLVLLGGDLIDNEGNTNDESAYLDPLQKLVGQYPIYYILGNHEYGISNRYGQEPIIYTGDRSRMLIDRMRQLGIPLLRDQLACPIIKNQTICIFGIDDIWHAPNPDFSSLVNCHPERSEGSLSVGQLDRDSSVVSLPLNDNCVTPPSTLIFLTHNPDGILTWPKDFRSPNLVLAGHTHGGQVYLPFVGPLGNAGLQLPKQFYRGLNYLSLRGSAQGGDEAIPTDQEIASPSARNDTVPVFTSVGIGESGGQLRFWTLPEIAVITLKPVN